MAMSDDAMRLTRIAPIKQVRFGERASFVYVEYARISQAETGVVAMTDQGIAEISIPTSSISLVMLGPGTTITHAAASSIAACGATILWTDGMHARSYAAGTPLTSSARWAKAQARMWADPKARRAAARTLYASRFPGSSIPEESSIKALRGMEGALVREAYRHHAAAAGIRFRRKVAGDDPVNIALNVGNSILYGIAASCCSALGISPALGVIHDGNASALLFDLADVFKLTTSVPAAFACAKSTDPAAEARRKTRSAIQRQGVQENMFELVTSLLEPYLDEDPDADRLIGDSGEADVEGHVNYEDEAAA